MKKIKLETQIEQIALKHDYPIPYERDDRSINLSAENNPFIPATAHEAPMGKRLYADVNFEYNYFEETYEQFSQQIEDTDTFFLPSLNYFLLRKEGGFPELEYEMLFSALGAIPLVPERVLSKIYFGRYANAMPDIVQDQQYYTDWNKIYHNLKLKTEYISKKSIDIYRDIENRREMFPFFGKVHLTGMPKSTFAGIMETASMDKLFIDFLLMHRENHDQVAAEYSDSLEQVLRTEFIRYYKHDSLLNHIANHGASSFSFDSAVQGTTDCDFLERYVMIEIAKQKMLDYIQKNLNTNKTEPIAYRLEKYNSEGTFELIQSSYFFNLSELEEFRLYDTQVSYGHHYTYRIKVINAVFSEELLYLEEPYYEDYFRVLDSPPIAPDVELITYRGVDDKILITFNSMIDQKVEAPIIINPSDAISFGKQWEAQKIPSPNPILFESDDPTMFEIFRLENKPTSYHDFASAKYNIIGKKTRTSAGYHDDILPNKYYYYMFRAQDYHGHVSNPSEVYEFRLNKEGETLYPTIRIVDFKPKDPPTQKNFSFKRYLKIALNASQYQIPESEISKIDSNIIDKEIKIGTSNESLAGSNRKFKFRIKSKNTGKLIDINVTFKKNKVFSD